MGPLLKKMARGVQDGYEERHQAQTVSQIRDFMKKLSKLQHEHKSLSLHVGLAERIQRLTSLPAFHKRLECACGRSRRPNPNPNPNPNP